jgi:phosphopantetheine--protein transferase-like protein
MEKVSIIVIGVGTDILKIQRIRDILRCESTAFITKTFTEKEQAQAAKRDDPALYYATRFAGKEAVFKCFGSDGNNLRLNDIEILTTESGQPKVFLTGNLNELALQIGIQYIHLSISYEDEHAIAFAMATE